MWLMVPQTQEILTLLVPPKVLAQSQKAMYSRGKVCRGAYRKEQGRR